MQKPVGSPLVFCWFPVDDPLVPRWFFVDDPLIMMLEVSVLFRYVEVKSIKKTQRSFMNP